LTRSTPIAGARSVDAVRALFTTTAAKAARLGGTVVDLFGAAHFSRAFKAAHGWTPAAYRALAAARR
jgi:transcriptional regulator GlxA family with amidase domain